MSAAVTSRVLIVDDDLRMCEMLATALAPEGFEVVFRTSGDEAVALLASEEVDAVVTDVNMRGMSGLELCAHVAEAEPDVPVIVITAFGSLESAVAAIRAGAYDYVTKPFDVETLALTLARAVQHRALRREVVRLRKAVSAAERYGEIVGESPAMHRVYTLLDRLAASDATTLVTGESGTGKELIARAIHDRSRRKAGPFVAVNCAAMAETLLESEMFGHVKGAFTDARSSRRGLFAQANGGSIFLDEIGDMPLGLQVKLLRTLQERTVRPVGGDAEVGIDVRVIAATNRDLDTAVEEHRFREDLFYRLDVIHLEMPPLRARGNDVLLLAQQFVTTFAARTGKAVRGLGPQVAERLLSYPWPGNVRELQNCIERAVALTAHDTLVVDDLPEKVRDWKRSHVLVTADDPAELVPMEEVERRYILRVMDAVAGNKTEAARILGLDRKTLYRKLEKYRYEAPTT
jgi:DNA-binding NtrC family response regulator